MDDRVVTQSSPSTNHKNERNGGRIAAIVALILVIGVGGFVGGIQYEKGKTTSTTAAGSVNGFQAAGRGAVSQNGAIGTVTSISSSSISVKDQRTNSIKTYSISSNTSISDNANAATISDITTGSTVLVTASSSTSTSASRIIINPAVGGGSQAGPSMPGGAASSTSTIAN